MRPAHKRNTNIGIGLGLVLDFLGSWLVYSGGIFVVAGIIILLLAAAAFIWGCMSYAEGKGHPKWLGLLGLFSLPGLIIIFMFPDHCRGAQ